MGLNATAAGLPSVSTRDLESDRVAAIRDFNRFYTNIIGVLRGGLLDTPYSLTEARVIFELAQHAKTDVADLRRSLDIDAGYLSRILARFEADGVVARDRSAVDGRRQVIGLTETGRSVFGTLDERSNSAIRHLVRPLSDDDRTVLLEAMGTIRRTLASAAGQGPGVGGDSDERRSAVDKGHREPAGDSPAPDGSRVELPWRVVLREPHPGEYGWVIERHGALYAQEYGWDTEFEALVARIVADFLASHDPGHERAWIAELDGRPVGCIFCVRRDGTTAQLRLLLVEPAARGAGIGSRLVEECMQFARQAGYRDMMLWTNDVLVDARRIYERAGFGLTEEAPHHSFGHDLVEQIWRRPL